MNSLAAVLTSLAVLLPMAPLAMLEGAVPEGGRAGAMDGRRMAGRGLAAEPAPALRVIEQARRTPEAAQVRIEQRVIIRIAPSSPQRIERSLSQIAPRTDRFEEVRLADCVPINMIAAVAPQGERLLLIMRDRRILSAALERSCNPEDFYSGFYIERLDGQLCERRDRLQSRTGANCRVTRLNRLVAAND